jgi:hypothetical protein
MAVRGIGLVAACFVAGFGIGYGLFQPGPFGTLREAPFGLRGSSQDFSVPDRAPFIPFPQDLPAILRDWTDDSTPARTPTPWNGYAPEDESRVG